MPQTFNGLFWDQAIAPKIKAPKRKPDPFWLKPDYLPGLESALAMKGVERITQGDWIEYAQADVKDWFSFDTECYPNYFSVGFKNLRTGKVDWLEMTPETAQSTGATLNRRKLDWILRNVPLVGFNSTKYDLTMLALALHGCSNAQLKEASDMLIVQEEHPSRVLKHYRARKVMIDDHIDLQEIAPGFQSLKTFGGRMHTGRMQDLPFAPGTSLSWDQITIVRYYLCNDLQLTGELCETLRGQIDLRIAMSNKYGINLLSKSDAQIAETVLRTEYERTTGNKATIPVIEPGTSYKYAVPDYLEFQSQEMRDLIEMVRHLDFVVGMDGAIALPSELANLKISLGDSVYKLGIGGLHSTEKSVSHYSGEGWHLMDADVASFYPRIIINQGLYPEHLGPEFIPVYVRIVDDRLACKEAGDKVGADSLKIVINASFGKFGNKWSVLYSPQFVIQVTLSGQLSLLMLIDALESAGIRVVSANTDGIIINFNDDQRSTVEAILAWWQETCQFKMEYTNYVSTHNRDVNSYFAIKRNKDGTKEVKRKGAYATQSLSTTPNANVCANAVEQYLLTGKPVADYIRECKDIMDFVIVRNVSGGAVIMGDPTPVPKHRTPEELIRMAGYFEWHGGTWKLPGTSDLSALSTDRAYAQAKEILSVRRSAKYLGKVVRFYIGNGDESIVYAKSGARVPQSEGAVPYMDHDFTNEMPDNVCLQWYIDKAYAILAEIGVTGTPDSGGWAAQFEAELADEFTEHTYS